MWRGGRLFATYKDGRAHLNAYLDDYAFLIGGLLELMQAEFESGDLDLSEELADVLLDQFEDAQAGGVFSTARDPERRIHRPKTGHHKSTPPGDALGPWGPGRPAALAR